MRNKLSGDVFWWDQNHSLLVARFDEKAIIGRRVGGTKITACWWLALARRQLSGDVC